MEQQEHDETRSEIGNLRLLDLNKQINQENWASTSPFAAKVKEDAGLFFSTIDAEE